MALEDEKQNQNSPVELNLSFSLRHALVVPRNRASTRSAGGGDRGLKPWVEGVEAGRGEKGVCRKRWKERKELFLFFDCRQKKFARKSKK